MNKFIKDLLSSGDDVSSKRVSGIALIVSFIIMEFISLFVEINQLSANLIETGLYMGVVLLTGSAIEKIWKK